MVSADRKPFQPTIIPTPYNHQQYIVDTINSLQAMVIVKHNSSLYNLYMSEEQGVYYYNALTDLKVDQTNSGGYVIDLESVRYNIIIINIHIMIPSLSLSISPSLSLPPSLPLLPSLLPSLSLPPPLLLQIDSMNHTTYIANQNVRTSPSDTNPLIRTLISFDVGANWQIVRPPVTDDNECIQVNMATLPRDISLSLPLSLLSLSPSLSPLSLLSLSPSPSLLSLFVAIMFTSSSYVY